jgi:sulfate transport system ATP-binding protein
MDHGRIEQIGTPEEVYMEPASRFVLDFVGETNRLPGGLHVRPHDLERVESGEAGDHWPVVVDNVFRKGGAWRVEGVLDDERASGSSVVEIDLDADRPAPLPGSTIHVRPTRSKTFIANGANHDQ